MAITVTLIDGNNVALAYSGSVSANLLTLNTTTGVVTSSYLPDDWCRILSANVKKLLPVTTLAQRQTAQFLDRLIALGSLDGTTISTAASVGSGTATLVVTVSGDTSLLVQLPHSLFGAASLGQSVPATGGGGGGGLVASDLGLVAWPLAAPPLGISVGQLADYDCANLVPATNTVRPCFGVYELDSQGNNAIRTYGPAGIVRCSSGIICNNALFLGVGGLATNIPPTGPAAWSQKIGRALGPSVETSPGSGVYVVPAFIQMNDAVYYP